MSEIKKPVILDETGKQMAALLNEQATYWQTIARAKHKDVIADWNNVRAIVQGGHAKEVFSIGDQLVTTWKDTTLSDHPGYEVPLDIVDFADVTLENGNVVPAMFLQWHYCTPFGVQFDHQENEVASEPNFLAKFSYYTHIESDKYKLLEEGVDYTNDSPIPTDKTYYHSAVKDRTGYICHYGYGRWAHSAIRQWLNSDKKKNEWWTAQHDGDVAPNELTSKDGFITGFEPEFLRCIRPIKVQTGTSTVTDSGELETTYDRFFLPALEQMYAERQIDGEGTAFEYWRQAVNKPQPNGWWTANANPAYITYGVDNHNAAQYVRLRSAYRYNSYITWNLYTTGFVGSDGCAYYAFRCCPVCAIC